MHQGCFQQRGGNVTLGLMRPLHKVAASKHAGMVSSRGVRDTWGTLPWALRSKGRQRWGCAELLLSGVGLHHVQQQGMLPAGQQLRH